MSPHPLLTPVPPLFDPTKAKRVKLRTHTIEQLPPLIPLLPLDMPVRINLYNKLTLITLDVFYNITELEHIRQRPNLTTVQSTSSVLKISDDF